MCHRTIDDRVVRRVEAVQVAALIMWVLLIGREETSLSVRH